LNIYIYYKTMIIRLLGLQNATAIKKLATTTTTRMVEHRSLSSLMTTTTTTTTATTATTSCCTNNTTIDRNKQKQEQEQQLRQFSFVTTTVPVLSFQATTLPILGVGEYKTSTGIVRTYIDFLFLFFCVLCLYFSFVEWLFFVFVFCFVSIILLMISLTHPFTYPNFLFVLFLLFYIPGFCKKIIILQKKKGRIKS
jgi:hypothetical protein